MYKKKITYTATIEGLERAEKALKRLGFGSKSNFAKSILVSRTTVTKFFAGKPIQFDSFQKICQELQLSDWKDIAGIKKEDIQIKSESSELSPKIPEFFDKWRKVQEIINQGATGFDLSDTDLSDTDLTGANLTDAILNSVLTCNTTMPDGTVDNSDCK